MHMGKVTKMLTVKEAAAYIGAGESSIRLWAKNGRFPNAVLEETPAGSYYLIPETDLKGFKVRGRGRPSKPKEKKADKKKSPAN